LRRPHRDILQVRVAARKSPRCRAGLDECCMDTTRFGIDLLRECVNIGGKEFFMASVFKKFFREGMFSGETLKDSHIGGEAALSLFCGCESQLLKEDSGDLLG